MLPGKIYTFGTTVETIWTLTQNLLNKVCNYLRQVTGERASTCVLPAIDMVELHHAYMCMLLYMSSGDREKMKVAMVVPWSTILSGTKG